MRSSARRERWTPDHRGDEEELGDPVAVAHRVDAVGGDVPEAERLLQEDRGRRGRGSRRWRRSRAGARRRGRARSAQPRRGRARAARRARAASGRPRPAAPAAGGCSEGITVVQVLLRLLQRAARCRARSSASSRATAPRAQSRVSVATWSLRERPVWSFPATAPASSRSSRSTSEWMSSSGAALPLGLGPALQPLGHALQPRRRARATPPASSTPAPRPAPRPRPGCPATSSRHSRRSTGRERFSRSISSDGSAVKRPPQRRWGGCGTGSRSSTECDPGSAARRSAQSAATSITAEATAPRLLVLERGDAHAAGRRGG